MNHSHKRLRSAFVLHIIIIHIQASTAYYPVAKRYIQNASEKLLRKHMVCKQMECIDYQQPSGDAFNRDTKSADFPHMLAIDLSQLRPRSPGVPTISRQKPPVNLLGVDISVLSQNPAPNLPIVPSAFDITHEGKIIHKDNFDPLYDRLPRLENDPIRNYLPQVFTPRKIPLLYPFQHLPLNIMTTYHFIAKNKKQEENFKVGNHQKGNDNEKKYTANFILQLLYQLSSNH